MTDPRTVIAAAMQQLISTRLDLMLDECTVTRAAVVDPTPVLDSGGNPPAAADTTVYAGRCTIADPTEAQQGGRTLNDDSGVPDVRVLRVPHAAALRPGDLVTVTASAVSPGLVSDRFLVLREDDRTYATYRRYHLGGSSWPST